jgi:hypothetical protein
MRPIIWGMGIALVAILVGFLGNYQLANLSISSAPERQSDSFELAGARYEIALPRGARLKKSATPTESVDVDFAPEGRLLRFFVLRPVQDGHHETYARSERLRNGALLRYNVNNELGGGSGGMEGELGGQITIGAQTLAVICHDQDEFPGPDPYRLCVPYLQLLKAENTSESRRVRSRPF